MKIINILLISIILISTPTFAQIKITTIPAKKQDFFIISKTDLPVYGLYQFENKSEPIIQLNADGTGIFQNQDLTKTEIIWGLECTEKGYLRFKEGFDSAAYTMWYKTKDNHLESDPEEYEDWTRVGFTIHFKTKKMYIMGERIKTYIE